MDHALQEGRIVLGAVMGMMGRVRNRTGPRGLRSAFMAAILLISLLSGLPVHPVSGQAGSFGGGDGSAGNPYVIEDVWDLQNMSGDLDACYVLGNDIDASATALWNAEAGFVPVGTAAASFTGSLDGLGHMIGGLHIGHKGEDDVGLIGHFSGGSIRDVRLVDCDVTGREVVGALAGSVSPYVNVTGCSASGHVSGYRVVGGLIGQNMMGMVSGCTSNGSVTSAISHAGGLVGYSAGPVADCSATTNVTGGTYVGGLIGTNLGAVYRSHASGSVNGTMCVGGLVGANNHELWDCYAASDITGVDEVGGLEGRYGWSEVRNSHYDIDAVLINGGHQVTRGGVFHAQYIDWLDNGMRLDISNYSSTLIWNASIYDVAGIPGLRDLLGFADRWGYQFHLASDLNLSSAPGLYVPYLSASTFDGDGHVVSDLSIDQAFTGHLGLFGCVAGEVRGVGVRGFDIASGEYAGGLVGWNQGEVTQCRKAGSAEAAADCAGALVGRNDGTVSLCTATGSMRGTAETGGLVGCNGGTVSECSATGRVDGGNGVGGLVADNNREVSDCSMAGDVRGGEGTGGLVGTNSGTIARCRAVVSTRGTYIVGGLAGENGDGTISGCYVSGDVEGTRQYTGGLVGLNMGTVSGCDAIMSVDGTSGVGGLIGFNYGGVSQCYATGSVNGTGADVGGLVGVHMSETVSDCYATADIRGAGPNVGGLMGNVSWGQISHCYSAGNVSCPGQCVGGLMGSRDGGTVTSCFWDVDTSGQGASAGGTGENTSSMMQQDTFASAGWDFFLIWGILEDRTYPFLRCLYSTPVLMVSLPDAEEEEPYVAPVLAHPCPLPGLPDPYRYDMSTDCAWLGLSPDGVLRGTPSNGDVGTCRLNITVTDALSYSDTREYELRVIDVNDAPEILSTSLPDALEDTGYSTLIEARDIDLTGDVLAWDMVGTDADFLKLDPGTGRLTGTPRNGDVGLWWVAVRVTDGRGGSAAADLTLTVLNVNDDPVITTTALGSAVEDQPFRAVIEGHDIDPTGDVLEWGLETDASFLTLDPRTGELSGTPSDADVGERSVNISLSDGKGGLAWKTFVLRVINTNDAPAIVTTMLPDAVEDIGYRAVLAAEDPDPGDSLVWRLVGTDADFLALDPVTGTLSGTPDNGDVGTWSVTVEVRDTAGATRSVTLVLRVLNVNDAPVVITTGLAKATEDQAYDFTCEATDVDPTMDALEWGISTSATFLTIDRRTGRLSGTPTNDDVGEWSVNVSVNDGNGGTAWANLKLTVVNVNDLPVLNGILPVNGSEFKKGRTIDFSVNASDEDGDALTITWKTDGEVLGTGSSLEYSKLGKGKHTVTVVVDDGTGAVEDSIDVIVKEDKKSPGAGLALIALAIGSAAIVAASRRRS